MNLKVVDRSRGTHSIPSVKSKNTEPLALLHLDVVRLKSLNIGEWYYLYTCMNGSTRARIVAVIQKPLKVFKDQCKKIMSLAAGS